MTMFAVPKAFLGDDEIRQRNAIASWLRLEPTPQVLLLGKDPGVAEAAAELGVQHIPDIAVNDFGTPLLDSAFAVAEREATFPLMCYVNADIILLSDFPRAVATVAHVSDRFLMVGRRWNVSITQPLVFDPSWEEVLRRQVAEDDELYPPVGSDYFVFRAGTMGTLPSFAVGRGGWDNWMFFRARELGMDLVDATEETTVVHQNHGYGHVKEQSGPAPWDGAETEQNLTLLGGPERRLTLEAATHRLMDEALVPLPPPHVPWRTRVRRLVRRG